MCDTCDRIDAAVDKMTAVLTASGLDPAAMMFALGMSLRGVVDRAGRAGQDALALALAEEGFYAQREADDGHGRPVH